MKLSIIIVNYNVKHFLEQCLYSVQEAQKECDKLFGDNSTEIFVVDNDSQDNSCEMVKTSFPKVKLIENKKNVGFSTANNQAIKISKGKYVLLLNPDTLVAEDTFAKTIKFMDEHEDAGGLGVKMIDGKGNFLPESKRSFPSPAVSFYKMFGLSSLFPKSQKFGKYHLTYLSKNETHKVDVLSGAFMMMRKETLNKSGLLDENFFMYGEDIDLSYRIIKAGWQNYYFHDTAIIHYKGESTKKGSLNYVFMFYNAMIIFAKKHFSGKKTAIFSILIKLAVWLRAGLSIAKRVFKSSFLPILDFVTFFAGFYFIKPIWEEYKFNAEGYYPKEYLLYAVPSYILIWIISIWISKGYKRPVDSKKLFKGILAGSFIILVFYSLLNEEYRFSRALLLLGTAWSIIFAWFTRAFFHILKIKEFGFKIKDKKNTLIIAEKEQTNKIKEILIRNSKNERVFKELNDNNNLSEKIKTYILNNSINEIVFCFNDLTAKEIITSIIKISKKDIEIKIAHPKTEIIIGSNSINTNGEIYSSGIQTITKPSNVRIKRTSDIILSVLFLILYPILFLLVENKINFFKNILSVFIGKYSWVGYTKLQSEKLSNKLPKIKEGILPLINYSDFNEENSFRINLEYAQNYNLTDDIYTIYKSFNNIGNKKL